MTDKNRTVYIAYK